jgi:hypothetical protein
VSDLFPLPPRRLKIAMRPCGLLSSQTPPLRGAMAGVARLEVGDGRFGSRREDDWLWYFWLALRCMDPWRRETLNRPAQWLDMTGSWYSSAGQHESVASTFISILGICNCLSSARTVQSGMVSGFTMCATREDRGWGSGAVCPHLGVRLHASKTLFV